jgi:hypothetical protein
VQANIFIDSDWPYQLYQICVEHLLLNLLGLYTGQAPKECLEYSLCRLRKHVEHVAPGGVEIAEGMVTALQLALCVFHPATGRPLVSGNLLNTAILQIDLALKGYLSGRTPPPPPRLLRLLFLTKSTTATWDP